MRFLYKLDSKGKLRQWGAQASGVYIQETSGLVDGKNVNHEKNAKPKNVGRSNATTAEEQAVIEVEAKYVKKLKEGYSSTIEEAKSNTLILPMLAKEYNKYAKKVTFPCYVQPKLDGMRCLCNRDGLMSRKATPIDTMDHILQEFLNSGSEYILDGELYAHGKTFQENMKLIKKYRPGESEEIKYHVYDTVVDAPFNKRSHALSHIVMMQKFEHIKFVETVTVNDEKALIACHADNIEQGYEGSIVRWGDAPYKANGRSENLLKYKDFKDIACPIVDVIPMDARPDQGLVVCLHNGQEFKATPKMGHEEKKQLLINKDDYIGDIAEIRYFEETDGGLPRFPVFVGVRLDK